MREVTNEQQQDGLSKSRTNEQQRLKNDGGVVVLARPPVVYFISILVGFALNAVWPVKLSPLALEPLGLLFIVLAVALFALSVALAAGRRACLW